MKNLFKLIETKESILRETKVNCLISQMRANSQKIEDLRYKISYVIKSHRLSISQPDIQDRCRRIIRLNKYFEHEVTKNDILEEQEIDKLTKGLDLKMNKLIQENNRIKQAIIKLKKSRSYNPYKLKYQYIELINELGFNLVQIDNDTNKVNKQVYEYNGTNENVIEIAYERIKEIKKLIRHEVNYIENSYMSKFDNFEHKRFESNYMF